MELWIRSQDRKCLENVYSLCLFEISNGKETRYVIENSDCLIAEYKTEERALEVLDEIQRLITDLQYMSYAVDSSSFYSYRPNVYEMPKE